MLLDKNQKAFFTLLKAGLWEKEARLSQYKDINYAAILQLAEEQSVVGLVTAGLEHVADVKVPQEWVLQFVGETLQIEEQNKAMNQFLGNLVGKMRQVGIYALLLKGQGVAQCYEKPLWRSSGDVDLFLSDDNYNKAKDYLKPLASRVESERSRDKHLGMSIDNWEVEIHGRLYCGLSSRIEKELDIVYKDTFFGGNVRSWNNGHVQVFLLSPENDAFYVFTHILQHFYRGGIGLRQLCDWGRLLWCYQSKLDLQALEKRIRKAGLMSEWRAFGALAVEYLGMPVEAMPFYSPDKKWRSKAERICAFVMEVGNFGHNSDKSYFEKYPYLIRKIISLGKRIGDLYRHAKLFPLDSFRFAPYMFFNGVQSAVRGEG